MTYAELKLMLKEDAANIKQLKSTRKSVPDGYVPGLLRARYDYRHYHIAYCLLRGRTIEQIEPKVAEGNEHNESWVKQIMASITFPQREAEPEALAA